MSQIKDIGSYDVIIIGSGMGGLVAGNALARMGHSVLMVEKHTIPGGYTTNFERKDYRFEVSTHLLNGCEPGGAIYEILEHIDAQDEVEFIKLDTLIHWRDRARGTDVRLPVALDEYVNVLAKLYPHEEKGIRGFYAAYEEVAEFLFSSSKVSESEMPAHTEKHAEAIARFGALKGKSAADILAPYVSDPDLIDMMTILCGLFGLGHDEIDAFIYIMCDLSYRIKGQGAYYPKGGSGHFSKKLADLFEKNGGTLVLNREVTQLTFSDGLVDGVVARKPNGQKISAHSRCVVANSDLTALVHDLCPEGTFPAEYIKGIDDRVPCISAVILYVGLDIDLRDYGITEYENHTTWGEKRTSALINEINRTGDYSRLPYCDATVYSNIDPTCCPEGKSVICTLCFADPELFQNHLDDGRKRGKAYKELKKKITAQLLEKMARSVGIPDLADHAEVVELATPVTLTRYTHHRAGSFVGWQMSPDQGGGNAIPQESPVPNLFLCGQWVFPAGGVGPVMMGGRNVATLADDYLGQGS
jgi:prolycopene isomerase